MKETIEIGRRVGGIGWPGDQPGFVVVLGEEKYPYYDRKTYRYCLLDEAEENDLSKLIDRCLDFKKKTPWLQFVARRDADSLRYLRMRANGTGNGLISMIRPAPHSETGLISYHINLLKSSLISEKKTLFLNEKSKLSSCLMAVPSVGIDKITDGQFPAVAALGYALAVLIETPQRLEEEDYNYNKNKVNPITGY